MKVKKRLDIHICIIALLLMMACAPGHNAVKEVISKGTTAPAKSYDTSDKDQDLQDKMSRLRIPFIANEGQIQDNIVKYYAKTFGGTLYVTENGEMVYSLPRISKTDSQDTSEKATADRKMDIWVLRENLVGAYEIHPDGVDEAVTKIHSYKGSDKDEWKTDIPTYNDLSLGRVYDGIDLALKAYGNNVEKVFTVYPSGNAGDIELKIEGASSMSINHDGELELETGLGPVRFSRPVAYQEIAGEKKPIEVAYNIKGDAYGFQVAEYNNEYPLIIDPLLASTFIGGTSYETAYSIVLDSSNNVYVTGDTQSSGYPTTSGTDDETWNGNSDVFVSKLTSDLTTLSASTFIGGGDYDYSYSIALDSSDNVYVTGRTRSSDYPTTSGTYDEIYNDDYDVFVSKLTSDLTTLSASTFIGGADYEEGYSISLDSSGNVYVTGYTESSDYPVTSGAYDEGHNGSDDVFVSKLTADLTALSASTFIGGSSYDYGRSIALDDSSNVYVTGYTYSSDYPITSEAYDDEHNGSDDVFVSKLTADLTALSASTFIGGADYEEGYSISLDSSDNVYVTGYTESSDYPITSEAYDDEHNGSDDVFVSKLTSDLTTLTTSTFIGGAGVDRGYSISLDSSSNVYVTGYTYSSDYPTTSGAYDETFNGEDNDVFVSKLTTDLVTLSASTFIGGSEDQNGGRSIALDDSNNVYVTGYTYSSDYPTTYGAYNETHNGISDVFISKLSNGLSGSPIYINIDNTGTEDGTTWDTGYNTIQEGIDAAVAGDELWIKQGTYYENITLKDYVSLYGGFDGTETLRDQRDWINNTTTIDGENESRVITGASYLSLDGFTISNGYVGEEEGGGIYNSYVSSMIIQNCTFTGNNAEYGNGGAIYYHSINSSITIIDCVFDNNSTGSIGGAVYNSEGMVNMTGCTFEGNSGSSGGAVYSYAGNATITDCDFTNNSSTSNGGAVYIIGSDDSTITDSTFTSNSSTSYGGAAYIRDSDITITGSVFTENINTDIDFGSGGAIYNYRSSPVITDCTFTRNSTGNSSTIHSDLANITGYSGGAIYYSYYTSGTEVAVPNITNCTFEENESLYGGAIAYEYDSSDANLTDASITNCKFINNWASSYSGAVSIVDTGAGDYGEPEIINCLFTGNVSDIGGVSRNQDGEPLFLNCTFSGNTTNDTTYGSTIVNSGAGQIATYINCIFWGNSTGNEQEIYNEGTVSPATPEISYSNIEGSGGSSAWDTNLGTDGGNNIDADPLFVSASDYHLQIESPSIDTGDNSQTSLPATDIEGNTRIQNSIVDMGAYEYETDTDSDGMDDDWETTHFGDLSHDGTADSDEDILTDLQEFTNDTDPNVVDSDNDGYYDGEEIASGTDPNSDLDVPVFSPGTYYVDADAVNYGDGSSGSPWRVLHHAVDVINDGSAGAYFLYVDAGTYTVTDNDGFEPDEGLILAQDNVTVIGSPEAVLEGTYAQSSLWNKALEISASNISITGLEINNFYYDYYYGILVTAGDLISISNCTIQNGNYAITIESEASNISITHCTIYTHDRGAITVDDSAVSISYNRIYNNVYGVYISENVGNSITPVIVNNLIYNTLAWTDYGIVLVGNTEISPVIAHNTISGGRYGIYIDGAGGASLSIQYNIISNFSEYGIMDTGTIPINPVLEYNNVYSSDGIDEYLNVTAGGTDISEDPLYLDAAAGDYHLQTNSPCVDAIPTDAGDIISDDLDGNTRPLGSRYDMGAYETQQEPSSQYILTINTIGQGNVTLNPSGGTYDAETDVTLTANPETGWEFTGWSGALTGTANPAVITMDSDKNIAASFVQNSPPSAPTGVSPEEEEIVTSDSVLLTASAFSDPDSGDSQVASYWMIRRADSVYGRLDYDESFNFEATSGDLTSYEVTGLSSGMKYMWKVGYVDSGSGETTWSDEYSFKVGESVSEVMPEIEEGTDIVNYKMMSFPYWLDDPSALYVFDIEYDTRYYRIGHYEADRNSGEYVEIDDPDLEINPGEAMWVLCREGLDVFADGIPVSDAYDIEVPLRYNETSGDGWNQIGCPNAKEYMWGDIEVIEYSEGGEVLFGPTPISELEEANEYVDIRIWEWADGGYDPYTPEDEFIMVPYEGYWVRAKKTNVHLNFPMSVQLTGSRLGGNVFASYFDKGKRWIKGWMIATPLAVADSGDSPPMPMGTFTDSNESSASQGGCFIATAAYGSPYPVILSVLFVVLLGIIGRMLLNRPKK